MTSSSTRSVRNFDGRDQQTTTLSDRSLLATLLHRRRAHIRIGDCCLSSIRGHVRVCMVFLRRNSQSACAYSLQWTDAGMPTDPHGITFGSLNTAFVTTEIAPTTFKLELQTDS